jgi:hypothetical protein
LTSTGCSTRMASPRTWRSTCTNVPASFTNTFPTSPPWHNLSCKYVSWPSSLAGQPHLCTHLSTCPPQSSPVLECQAAIDDLADSWNHQYISKANGVLRGRVRSNSGPQGLFCRSTGTPQTSAFWAKAPEEGGQPHFTAACKANRNVITVCSTKSAQARYNRMPVVTCCMQG